jgi:hypothetical protein
VGGTLDIHAGATYECDQCHGKVIFEAFTPEQYVQATRRLAAPAPPPPADVAQADRYIIGVDPATGPDLSVTVLRDEQNRERERHQYEAQMSAPCLACGHDYNAHTCHMDPRCGTSCATKDCGCVQFAT